MSKIKESDLDPGARMFLADKGVNEIHGEVLNIDLVGIDNNDLVIGVELKKSLNITVLEQAFNRLDLCDFVYIGVTEKFRKGKYHELNLVYRTFLEKYGIGLIYIQPLNNNGDAWYRIIKHADKSDIKKVDDIRKHFNEITLQTKGGVETKHAITPYKVIRDQIFYFLKRSGWNTLDSIYNVHEIELSKLWANPKKSLKEMLNAPFNKSFFTSKEIDGIIKYNAVEKEDDL